MGRHRLIPALMHVVKSRLTALVIAMTNLFVDEAGNHLTDENGNRLGEI